jgi:hypothetical protein
MSFRVDDEVPEGTRWRTYQKYPNPIYEMGWVLIYCQR